MRNCKMKKATRKIFRKQFQAELERIECALEEQRRIVVSTDRQVRRGERRASLLDGAQRSEKEILKIIKLFKKAIKELEK